MTKLYKWAYLSRRISNQIEHIVYNYVRIP